MHKFLFVHHGPQTKKKSRCYRGAEHPSECSAYINVKIKPKALMTSLRLIDVPFTSDNTYIHLKSLL